MIEKTSYKNVRSKLQTGDMVFFSGKGFVSEAIKLATYSEWSHVGLCIRVDALDLVLIWESTTLSNVRDIMTGNMVRGVQVAPLSRRIQTYDGYCGFRRMGIPDKFANYKSVLSWLRKDLEGKKYEESDIQLVKSAFNFFDFMATEPDLTSVFCSEMIAEFYIRLGLLPKDPPSLVYSPADLAEYDYF